LVFLICICLAEPFKGIFHNLFYTAFQIYPMFLLYLVLFLLYCEMFYVLLCGVNYQIAILCMRLKNNATLQNEEQTSCIFFHLIIEDYSAYILVSFLHVSIDGSFESM
jgi:hypothetical protein